MYCKNCGKLLEDGDKFCSNCGTKAAEQTIAEPGPGYQAERELAEEKPKRKFHIEEFNWDLEGYPTSQIKKTEDIDFNWESVLEEKQRRAAAQTPSAEEKDTEEVSAPQIKSLEEEIFGNLEEPSAAEPTKTVIKNTGRAGKTGRIDKFYTFNKRNEELQALLDQEYERIKNGDEPQDEEAPSLARRDNVSKEAVLNQILESSEEEAAPLETGEIPPDLVGVMWAQTPDGIVADEPIVTEKPEPQKQKEKPETFKPTTAEPVLPPSEEEKQSDEDAGRKLTFDDVFGADDNDPEAKPKKRRIVLKVIAIILCVLVLAELVMIGIQYFAPDSAPAKMINKGYQYVLDLFKGDDQDTPDNTGQSDELSDIAKLIKTNLDKNENLAQITEDQNILFSDNKDYGFEDFGNSYTFVDEAWYTDDEGKPVTYGEAIVGTLIQYYSSWVDKTNGKNDEVLDYIEETSDFYTDIESIEPKKGVQYGIDKLAIGEIRSTGSGFYVLTAITKVSSDSQEDTVENHIVYLEPEKVTMKIIEIKKI